MEWLWILLLPALWVFRNVLKKYELSRKKDTEENREERVLKLIGEIQAIPFVEYEGYSGETNEEGERLEKRRDEVLEKLMKKEEAEEEAEKLKREFQAFSEKKKEGFRRWETIQANIQSAIEENTAFFDETNFYPTDYLFDINRLRQKSEDAREYQLENPLKESGETEEFLQQFKEKIQLFKQVHGEVSELLPKLSDYEKELKGSHQAEYLMKKQEMFSLLQQGNVNEVKKKLNYFRSKVKN